MERINRGLVKKGIEQNIISFAMDDGLLISCIGDYWFYISSDFDKKEEDFSKEELINMVYESVNDEPINDEDEEQAGECLYYKAILEEAIV